MLATGIDEVLSGIEDRSLRAIGPVADGARPSGPDIDRVVISRLVDAFGMAWFRDPRLLQPLIASARLSFSTAGANVVQVINGQLP